MTKSVVWLLRLLIALAMLPALAGMVAAQDYRLNDGHVLEHPKEVVGLVFSPDGKSIATYCLDEDIRLWDVASGKETGKLPHGTGRIYPLGFADKNTLVVSRYKVDEESLEKTPLEDALEVWDLTTQKVKRTIILSIESGEAGMASGSNIVAVGSADKDKPGIDLWDVTKREKVGHLGQDEAPLEYAFTHDGKTMAVQTKHGVHIWDMAARKEKVYIPFKRQPDGMALATDGKTLFVDPNTNVNPIVLYNIPGGQLQDTTSTKCGWLRCIGCPSDGKVLVTALNGSLVLLETTTGKQIKSYSSPSMSNPRYLRTSPQGNFVAAAHENSKVVRLWKLEEKKEP